MTDKIKEYRTKHPRCRYCRYKKIINGNPVWISSADWRKCSLKDKDINGLVYYNIAGCFCKYFECGDDIIDEV